MATCKSALPTSLLDALRQWTLTEEQAQMIYAQGPEALVFALLELSKRIAEQQAAAAVGGRRHLAVAHVLTCPRRHTLRAGCDWPRGWKTCWLLPWKEQRAQRLNKRVRGHRHDVSTFLEQPDIPFDNNTTEWSVRPAVIMGKIGSGNRSQRGADCRSVLMSVLRTLKQHGPDSHPH